MKGEVEVIQKVMQNGSFISVRDEPIVYERFFYTKHLLHKKYHEFVLSLDKKGVLKKFSNLLKSQNFSNGEFSKLLQRIERWNKLISPIPLSYIEFIGLKPESIETAAKADMNAFKEAMKKNYFPESFFIRTHSGVLRVSLPDETSEKEAISAALNHKSDEGVMGKYICIKDLKTIVIEHDDSYYTLTYPPLINYRKNLFIPSTIESYSHDSLGCR